MITLRARRSMKKIGAIFATTTLAATGLLLSGSQADAATNSEIQVQVVDRLVRVDQNLEPVPGPITINTAAKLKFTWDATNANPKPGDSFYIGVPNELINRGVSVGSAGQRQDLIFEGEKAGECFITSHRITCTLGEEIRGKRNIKGEGSLVMNAEKETSETYLEFDLNGKVERVPLPDDRPITAVPGSSNWSDWGFGKAAYNLAADSTALKWNVTFGTDSIAANTKQVFDGSVQTLRFKDKLGEGAKFDTDLSKYSLLLRTSQAQPGVDGVELTRGDGTDKETKYGDYDLRFTVEDGYGVFELTGPFTPSTNYQLTYTTPFTNGTNPVPSFFYSNSIELEGSALRSFTRHRYEHAFYITIQMEDGYGALTITKKITGDAAAEVAAENTYPVEISYLLPGNNTAAAYPSWGEKQPPSNPFTLHVSAGKETEVPFHFPHGTTVTVTEPGIAGSTSADGKVLWGDPVIKINGVGDSASASAMVENQVISRVEITNTATPPAPPAGPPAPPAGPPAPPTPPVVPPTPPVVPPTPPVTPPTPPVVPPTPAPPTPPVVPPTPPVTPPVPEQPEAPTPPAPQQPEQPLQPQPTPPAKPKLAATGDSAALPLGVLAVLTAGLGAGVMHRTKRKRGAK